MTLNSRQDNFGCVWIQFVAARMQLSFSVLLPGMRIPSYDTVH